MLNILLLLLHFYFPYINYDSIDVSPDFFLLIILSSSLKLSQNKILVLSFSIGVLKDILTQYYFFGLLSFIHILLGYITIRIQSIKDKIFQYSYIFFIIFIYFLINYMLQYSESYIFYLKFSFIKAFLTFLTFFLFKTIFKKSF